jgi:hypothetical protein
MQLLYMCYEIANAGRLTALRISCDAITRQLLDA